MGMAERKAAFRLSDYRWRQAFRFFWILCKQCEPVTAND